MRALAAAALATWLSAPGGAAQGVTLAPELALPVERAYRSMTTELVFCLDAEPGAGGGWSVTAVRLARQSVQGQRDAASFECGDAEGFLHNHPRPGTRWCRLSDTDRQTLQRYAFAVLWCPSNRFSYEIRLPPKLADADSSGIGKDAPPREIMARAVTPGSITFKRVLDNVAGRRPGWSAPTGRSSPPSP